MENFYYTCEYCSKEYIPKRRYKQRFCSNSCRVSAFKRNQKPVIQNSNKEKKDSNPIKIEKMSMAGIGNATVGAMAGTVAVNLISSFLTHEDNKPATKKDIKEMIVRLNKRYFPVKNLQPKPGYSVFYDSQTSEIVQFKI